MNTYDRMMRDVGESFEKTAVGTGLVTWAFGHWTATDFAAIGGLLIAFATMCGSLAFQFLNWRMRRRLALLEAQALRQKIDNLEAQYDRDVGP